MNSGWHAHKLTKPGEFLISDPEHATPEPNRAYRDHDPPEQGVSGNAIALLSVCLGFFVIQLDVTIVNVALPAMTAAVVSSAGAEHAGVASGILNAARQSGGALGVALLGSLLGSGAALSLHLPLAVAAGGYLVAVALAAITIRGRN